ncbi:SixA phosphatase family protein [Nibrella viscosa]
MLKQVIWLVWLGGCLSLTGCSTTTVYIVRHAERANDSDTTSISAAGHQRAQALADRLAGTGIDSIFTTPYLRTRQTAAPLAQRLNIQPVTYPTQPTQTVVDRLKRIRSKEVLVVGHSNTVLEIVRGLGARPSKTKIEHNEYNNLFVVTLRRRPFAKSADVSALTYGASPTQ